MPRLSSSSPLLHILITFTLLPSLLWAEPLMKVDDRIANIERWAAKACESDGGELILSGDEVVLFDFNDDGEIDLTILHEDDYNCSGSNSIFSGSLGAVAHFFTAKDYEHFYVWDVDVVTAFDSTPIVLFTSHPMLCDEVGYAACVGALTIFEGRIVR